MLDRFIVADGERPPRLDGMPLRVSAILASPVVTYDETLMLDGILEWAAYRRAEAKFGRDSIPELRDDSTPLTWWIPLSWWERGESWGWCASAAIWPDEVVRSTHHVTRKPPVEYMQRHTDLARVDIALGTTKAKRMPAPQIHARAITWYAVGSRDAVQDLLCDVQCVGKLAGHGRGWVHEWLVETVEDAPWEQHRRMPSESPEAMQRTRPPYWHRVGRVGVR